MKSHYKRKIQVLASALSLVNNRTLYYMQMHCDITRRIFTNRYTSPSTLGRERFLITVTVELFFFLS